MHIWGREGARSRRDSESGAPPRVKVRKVLDFLAEFEFIEYDKRKGKARANPAGMRILLREKSSELPVFF